MDRIPLTPRGWRACVLAILAAALVALTSAEAAAQSRLCRQLDAQLASLATGGSGAARRYDAAIERQREQIAIARDQAREARCGFAVVGLGRRQCAGINATIARMQRNLAGLEADRAGMGGTGRGERRRVLAALERNGCGAERLAVARPVEGLRGSDLEAEPALRETRAERRARERAAAREARDKERRRREREREMAMARAEPETRETPEGGRVRILRGGDTEPEPEPVRETFRTMCVRTCDGYFFPMSPVSSVSDFERDQTNCEAACPGAAMEVFYGAQDGDDPSGMMSTRSGATYAELPTAFLHQRANVERSPACGCNARKPYTVIAGTPPLDATVPKAESAQPVGETSDPASAEPAPAGTPPVPTPRPDRVAALRPSDAPVGVLIDGVEQPAPGADAPAPIGPDPALAALPGPAASGGSIVTVDPPPAPAIPAAPPPAQAAAAVASPVPAQTSDAGSDPSRKVRVVGPEFLPDPAGAIDLRTPVPTPSR